MKVQFVSIAPTERAEELGCLALTPELLAATGARYSRNNEGLEAIASKIDFNNKDKSVDGIFKMIDYGHQSIADMTPIALFIDDISLFAAYYLWTLSPTAGGQECSTRYIKMGADSVVSSEDLGIPEHYDLDTFNAKAFDHYERSTEAWSEMVSRNPELARIPKSLIESSSPKDQRQVERMKRNYVFDRARVHLPLAAKTGVMMIQSARAWANVASHLQSHTLKELINLGAEIADKMAIGAPRLLKHTKASECHSKVIKDTFESVRKVFNIIFPDSLGADYQKPKSFIDINAPKSINENKEMVNSMIHRTNRYSPFGTFANMTSVRFGWDGITFGDIRDLNRHRTGSKYIHLCPLGFYGALDQIQEMCEESNVIVECDYESRYISSNARVMISNNVPEYIYFCKLGTQFKFEHVTTADKFIYEMELRTGLGAHYKYAEHCAEVLQLWYEEFPETKDLIFEGTAEPE
jgi:thymidylate synthase ThyX